METEGEVYYHSEESKMPSEASFSIIWKIENSQFFLQAGYKLQSPVLFVDVMEGTGWRLLLYRFQHNKRIYVNIKREAADNGPEAFDLHYDFDIGSKEAIKNKPCFQAFRKGEEGPPILLLEGNPLKKSFNLSQPYNITVRCIMKKRNGPISMSAQCIARTQIGGEVFEFISKVENFSALTSGAIRTLKVLSSSAGEKLMNIDLRIDSMSWIYIIPSVEKSEYRYTLSYAVLNWLSTESNIKDYRENSLQKSKLLLFATNETLKKHHEFYLPNDTLSLLFKITVLTGIKSEKIEQIEYGTVSTEDANQNVCSSYLDASKPARTSSFYDPKLCYLSQDNSSIVLKRKDCFINQIPSIIDDFTSFYKKGILCDVKLQTSTVAFPAHKAILSARSPVFEAMFTSDMKEKIEACVRIDDVEADTVKRLLLFLYSDTFEELKWEEAKKLHFAADKYQVLSLKYRCAVVLKKSIDLSNCCELLLLADIRQDEVLKGSVQSYIARNDKEVFLSPQWRELEKSHPHLAIDILRAVHINS